MGKTENVGDPTQMSLGGIITNLPAVRSAKNAKFSIVRERDRLPRVYRLETPVKLLAGDQRLVPARTIPRRVPVRGVSWERPQLVK